MKDIKILKQNLKKMFGDENTGHGLVHLNRVYKNALKIQKKEGGDKYVVAISALVHDVHRILSNKYNTYISPEDSLDDVNKILLKSNIDKEKITQILEVVKNHDNKENKNFSKETLIIQDADYLDAIGKIGLNRTLTFCNTKNIPLYSKEPLDSPDYIPEIFPISACHYIYRTQIPGVNNLYFSSSKKLAKDKVKYLQKFINKCVKDNKKTSTN